MNIREYKRKDGFTYIYGLYPPGVEKTPENCRYVGKTVKRPKDRLYRHAWEAKSPNRHCYCWIKSLLINNEYPEMKVIAMVPNRVAEISEINTIAIYRQLGARLTNLTIGGGGVTGFKFSEDSKKRMSISQSGENNGFYGKHHTDSTRLVLSKRYKGLQSPMFGRRHSEESKKKMSEGRSGIPAWNKDLIKPYTLSEETKKKISNAMIGNHYALGRPAWNKGMGKKRAGIKND